MKLKMEIHPSSTYQTENDYSSFLGRIYIDNDFYETIEIALDYWSIDDYKKQWKEGLKRIKTHDTSCLVASIQDPIKAPLINWWVLYKIGNEIFIQNELYVGEYYRKLIGNKKFTIDNCYDFITPRTTVSESGEEVSEWKIRLK